MTFDPKQTKVFKNWCLSVLGSIILTSVFVVKAFPEEIWEESFFEEGIELELEENFDFLSGSVSQDDPEDEFQDKNNSSRSIFNLFKSSVTVGNFSSQLSSSSSSKNKLILNISGSPEIHSLGFIDISTNFEINSKNRKFSNEIIRFNIQNSVDKLTWKLGKYRKTWGDVDGTSVLDIINPSKSILNQSLPDAESSSRWLGEASFFNSKVIVSAKSPTI